MWKKKGVEIELWKGGVEIIFKNFISLFIYTPRRRRRPPSSSNHGGILQSAVMVVEPVKLLWCHCRFGLMISSRSTQTQMEEHHIALETSNAFLFRRGKKLNPVQFSWIILLEFAYWFLFVSILIP